MHLNMGTKNSETSEPAKLHWPKAHEVVLHQSGMTFWFTGLSGAGKTTLADQLLIRLRSRGISVAILDGDRLREGLNRGLGFSDEDRTENLRRAGEVAKLFNDNGVHVIASFISPKVNMREMVQKIIGADQFREIFINCPLTECEIRDVKGLYAKARSGEIQKMTGLASAYEPPASPFLELRTDHMPVAESVERLETVFLAEAGVKKS
jgi:adenylylsulfate kinase